MIHTDGTPTIASGRHLTRKQQARNLVSERRRAALPTGSGSQNDPPLDGGDWLPQLREQRRPGIFAAQAEYEGRRAA